jgi:hypothetical protein
VTRPSTERVARALLDTFSLDEVPAASKERVFAALGVASGVTAIATVATGATSAGAAPAAAPAAGFMAKAAASVGAFSLVKAVIVGAGMGVLAVEASDRVVAHYDATPAGHPTATRHAEEPARRQIRAEPDRATTNEAVAVAPPVVPAEQPLGLAAGTSAGAVPTALPVPAVRAEIPNTRANRERGRTGRVPSSGDRMLAGVNAASGASTSNGEVASLVSDEKPATAPSAASSSSAASSAPATLTGEIARLDRARAALRQGAPGRALWELDGYDAEFASGSLRQEAAVLRIEVLVEMGENVRAAALADAFASAHPRSGYLSKIREMLARGQKRITP